MQSFDEVIRVAVLADPRRLSDSHARLLVALDRVRLPGFHVDQPAAGVSIGAGYDLVHLLTPMPGAVAVAAEHGVGLVAGFGALTDARDLRAARRVLSPTAETDAQLLLMGAHADQLCRWQPGVDPEAFGPGHYRADAFAAYPSPAGPWTIGDQVNVLVPPDPDDPRLLDAAVALAGRLAPRLRQVRLTREGHLPQLYASGDLLLRHSSSRDFPLDILEAQASGLPVLAVDAGAAREAIEDGRTGVLVPAETRALAQALLSLTQRATLRERLTVGGLVAVRARTWARSLHELTDSWRAAVNPLTAGLMRAA